MNDENEKRPSPIEPQDDDLEPTQPRPATPHTEEDVETVSLLDLMRQTGDLSNDALPPDEEETADLPAPLIITPQDDTGTITAAPSTTSSKPVGVPLAQDELTPPEQRPLESDQEATAVQPRVAFPGSTDQSATRPISEAPTQQLQRPSQTQPASSQTPTVRRSQPTPRQPAREPQHPPTGQPVRQQPTDAGRVAMPGAQGWQQPKPQTRRRRQWQSCLTRAIIIVLILGLFGLALAVVGAAMGYNAIASDLPSPQELRGRTSNFETARIYDRHGNELYALADPNTGFRDYVTLDQISEHLINATVATEDERFWENPGFDPIGITRAVYQAARERELVSGASTITQQLVRATLLEEDERTQRTFKRKLREIILAAEIARTYEKEEILELYLNEIYYGNLAYGIEAAAQTYFDKSAADLTLTEASLLAGLPQAPALWDPYSEPRSAIGRQWEVLRLMVSAGYVTVEEAQAALDEMNLRLGTMTPPVTTIRYPHFTLTVLQQAEEILGAQAIYRGGIKIYTTLDPDVQQLAASTITDYRSHIEGAGANNAAMVVLEPRTGEVLALVGSVDFNDEEIGGQVNMALQPRQPGSTIKPLVYMSAMEKGWTPGTLIWDIPTQFPDGVNPPYVPKNYDDQFHGPLLLRLSLGNSYNVTAVKALEYVGVCNFIANVQKLGLTSLQDEGCATQGQPQNYGLALALGGGEISPLEMVSAFGTLANQGQRLPPYTISRIENNKGEVQYTPASPEDSQVVRPEHAYMLNDILSDNSARQPEFGLDNSLTIPGFQVAAKTGTSGTTAADVRDAWTIGYSPEVVTAVWVGNTNYEPIGEGRSGYQVASPIWNSFMTQYLNGKTPGSFTRPGGVTESGNLC